MTSLLIGVDVGSTRVKAVVVDLTGTGAGRRRRGDAVGG